MAQLESGQRGPRPAVVPVRTPSPREEAPAKRPPRPVLPLLCLLVGLATLQARANGDSTPRLGRVSETVGTVWVYDRETHDWLPAERNQPLTRGDRLRTDRGALAEVDLGSTRMRLDSRSEIELQRLDEDRVEVFLQGGTLAVRVASDRMASRLGWRIDGVRFTPLRAGHYRTDGPGAPGGSYTQVWAGALRVDGGGAGLVLAAGERAALDLGGRGGVDLRLVRDTRDDRFSDWVATRDALGGLRLQDTRDWDEEGFDVAGWDELRQHGQWQAHPGLGRVWLPHATPVGWAPYRDGRWAWVAPWGWTWIDRAPWGFVPSHAGQWVWWNDRWAWAPGQVSGRPRGHPTPPPPVRRVPTGPIAYSADGVPVGVSAVPREATASPTRPVPGVTNLPRVRPTPKPEPVSSPPVGATHLAPPAGAATPAARVVRQPDNPALRDRQVVK